MCCSSPVFSSHTSQVNGLKFQLADLLELEEEWSEAARVLMSTSLESGQRCVCLPFFVGSAFTIS